MAGSQKPTLYVVVCDSPALYPGHPDKRVEWAVTGRHDLETCRVLAEFFQGLHKEEDDHWYAPRRADRVELAWEKGFKR